jgi:hypothetical protein
MYIYNIIYEYMKKEGYVSEIKNRLIEFYEQLEFQKKVFITVTESLSETEKFIYIKNVQEKQINDLFGNNNVIIESFNEIFPKKILTEGEFNIRNEIIKFNDFLFLSMCQKIGALNENTTVNPLKWVKKKYKLLQEQKISDLPQNQNPIPNLTQKKNTNLYNQIPDSPTKQQFVKDQQALGKKIEAAKKPKPETSILNNAINYINQNGISTIMEGLRSALFSLGGIAVQTILAFTGAGAIVNDVAWGILTLYDAYQYFTNGSTNYLFNLIIDIICLVTAGTLSGVLKNFMGKAATSVGSALKSLMESSAGNFIKSAFNTIKNGIPTLTKWLGESATFMKTKMGIGWASFNIQRTATLLKTIANELAKWVGGSLGSAAKFAVSPLMRAGIALGRTFEIGVLKELQTVAPSQIEKWVGKTVSQSEIKAAEKYAEENLKEKPTEQALRFLDSKFGTHMGDLYAFQLNAKKLGNTSAKLTKGLTAVDVGTEISRGRDVGVMQSRRTEPIKQSGSAILGL